uniref:LOW QUALITY PROTEIN: regulator of G-protein signaling 1-like n=1 Tax=Pristiophorus japonicus TaxID=55135 RepID=UPI00398E7353
MRLPFGLSNHVNNGPKKVNFLFCGVVNSHQPVLFAQTLLPPSSAAPPTHQLLPIYQCDVRGTRTSEETCTEQRVKQSLQYRPRLVNQPDMPELMFSQNTSTKLKEVNNNNCTAIETQVTEKRKAKNLAKDLKTRLFSVLLNSDSQHPSINFLSNMTGKLDLSIGLTREEAMQWSKSLDVLLADPCGRAAFRGFLKSEFSEENIDFWLVCEDYRKTKSSAKLDSKAQHIYTEFIRSDAPKQVNIDGNTRDLVSRSILLPTPTCFEGAQRIIFSLMEKDSYSRFLKSDAYLNLINKTQSSNS